MEPFDILSGKWMSYVNRFKLYLRTKKIDNDMVLPTFISEVGSSAYELMSDLCAPESPEEKTFDVLVQIVQQHLEPARSVVAERHVFRQRKQNTGENITNYIRELTRLARTCGFGDKLEENLRDQLASGVAKEEIRQQLFAVMDLNYIRAKEIALAMEAAETSSTINDAGRPKPRTDQNELMPNITNICYRCGYRHSPDVCPYQQFACNTCGIIGHIEKMCPRPTLRSYEKRPRWWRHRYRNRDRGSSDSGESPLEVESQFKVRRYNRRRQ